MEMMNTQQAKKPRTEAQRKYAREWVRERRKADPIFRKKECIKTRLWQKRNPIHNALNEYKKRSRAKGIAFELSDELFETLIIGDCYYCGLKANPINTIDRKINAEGYVPSNVLSACSVCNYAKRIMTQVEFEEWLIRAASHISKRRLN